MTALGGAAEHRARSGGPWVRASAICHRAAVPIRPLLLLLLLLCAGRAAAGVSVSISGIDGELRDNVEARLGIRQPEGDTPLDDALVRRLHAEAGDEIREALQPFGYYSPEISAELGGKAPNWKARYQIDPGPQTRLRQVEILLTGESADFPALLEARDALPLRSGQPLRHSAYEAAKSRLIETALDLGFLDARYTRAELRVEPLQQQADVLLTLDTGARWFFGTVTLDQGDDPQPLDPDFLQRYVRIYPGTPFRPRDILDTQFNLTDIDYFQSVEILPHRDQASGDRIPVSIRTRPRLPRYYSLGLGYGTDTGARISLGAEFRRLNDQGHKLRTDLRLSEVKNTLGSEYRIPLGSKPGESIGLTASLVSERFDDGDSLKYTLGTSLNRTPGDWQRRLYLSYEHEESDLGGQRLTTDLLIPGLSLNRSEEDDAIHPREGWSFFIDVHGAQKGVLANASFVQTRVLARIVLPISARSRLLWRSEVGANFVDQFSELPASQRFFAGGDQSVRGYAYQSLGPRDPVTGRVIGGQYLGAFSVEMDYRVWGNWGVAAFYDIGGADDTPDVALFRGVGGGLRYRAPVGFIQLDLGHALDGEDRSGVRVHIGIRVGL
ncbi:MAG: autotransporter assembly complex protein TamA [Gammaproteobacteria bacterium]